MSFQVDYFSLSGADATINKYVTLSGLPADTSSVALDIIGGTSQALGTLFTPPDFGMDTSRLTWAGYGLDGTMAAGDSIRVIYDRTSI